VQDQVWKQFTKLTEGNKSFVRCNRCVQRKLTAPNVTRMFDHLKDGCPKVPADTRALVVSSYVQNTGRNLPRDTLPQQGSESSKAFAQPGSSGANITSNLASAFSNEIGLARLSKIFSGGE